MPRSRQNLPTKGRNVRRMETASKAGLQRIYGDDEWADLKIVTAARVFPVHKAVVCPVWAFAKAACSNAVFVEAQNNEIKLPEDSEVIEAVLRHFYAFPLSTMDSLRSAEIDDASDQVLLLLRLIKAIDKYGVTSLNIEVEKMFRKKLALLRPTALTEIGVTIFVENGDYTNRVKDIVVTTSSKLEAEILRTPQAWQNIQGSPEYLHQTLLYGHRDTDPEMMEDFSGLSSGASGE